MKNIIKSKSIALIVYLILILISLIFLIIDNRLIFLFQSLFIGLVLIGFTYYFTNRLFDYTKKNKWEKIKKIVISEIGYTFSGILTHIAMFCDFRQVGAFHPNISNEEMFKMFDQKIIKQLKEFSIHKNIKISKNWKDSLLKGGFGVLFKKEGEELNQIQMKYLEFLEPEIIIQLIKLQKAFNKIDREIIIYNKYGKENKKDLMNLIIGKKEDVIKMLEKQFQIIAEGIQIMVDKGILKYNN